MMLWRPRRVGPRVVLGHGNEASIEQNHFTIGILDGSVCLVTPTPMTGTIKNWKQPLLVVWITPLSVFTVGRGTKVVFVYISSQLHSATAAPLRQFLAALCAGSPWIQRVSNDNFIKPPAVMATLMDGEYERYMRILTSKDERELSDWKVQFALPKTRRRNTDV